MVTVAICTYNRGELVRRAIDALARSAPPGEEWDLIIVDNGSTDDTSDQARQSLLDWPASTARIVLEPALGLSNARNRALRESKHEVVAFIDDDSVVSAEWLVEIQRSFRKYPRAAVIGGPIRVQWLDDEPKWMHPDLLGYFSGLDYGEDDCQLTYPRYPFGANFAVRRIPALEAGGFRNDLGYSGQSLISGEETELARRLEEMRWEIRYAARATVDHLITGKRATIDWLQKRAYAGGIAAGRLKRQLYRFRGIGQLFNDLRWLRYSERSLHIVTRSDRPELVRAIARRQFAIGLVHGWLGRSNFRLQQSPIID